MKAKAHRQTYYGEALGYELEELAKTGGNFSQHVRGLCMEGLKRKHPERYKRVVEAEKQKKFGG